MDESGEDRISNLPDSVVCHILSRLPTKDAVRTFVLSKDWEHKWKSIYNIDVDNDLSEYWVWENYDSEFFVSFVEGVLCLTRNSGIKSFSLACFSELDSQQLKEWTTTVLRRGVENLEINANYCKEVTFDDVLFRCKSLTKLRLNLDCTLVTSLMKNCFPNLKILELGHEVKISNDESFVSDKVVLNFSVMEELELSCCWQGVKDVKLKAPALIRFRVHGSYESLLDDYVFKIDGAKLEKFESSGFLGNVVFTAPSVSNVVLTNCIRGADLLRAHAILKGFPALERLRLSDKIVEVLTKHNGDFPMPCFNRLKQLELCDKINNGALLKLLQVMPSLESVFLYMGNDDKREESFPSGIASRLKIVKVIDYGSAVDQIRFAKSVLENVENLEKLFVSVFCTPSLTKNDIQHLLSTYPKSSTRASVVVTELRCTLEGPCGSIVITEHS